jgi:hypothetical protein
MRFVRFVLVRPGADAGVADGTFSVACELRDSPDVDSSERELLADTLRWFDTHLAPPAQIDRTTSTGAGARNGRGISWFKQTATEHLARMRRIKAVLEHHGHSVVMCSEARVGCVIYEDDYQVVADPPQTQIDIDQVP